jgi:hypothetical protein
MDNFSDLCNIERLDEIDSTLQNLRNLIQQGLNYKRKLNIWFESDELVQSILSRRGEIRSWYVGDKRRYNTVFELDKTFNKKLDEFFNENVIKSLICNGWCENNTITYSDILRYHYYTNEDFNRIESLLEILHNYNFGELVIK